MPSPHSSVHHKFSRLNKESKPTVGSVPCYITSRSFDFTGCNPSRVMQSQPYKSNLDIGRKCSYPLVLGFIQSVQVNYGTKSQMIYYTFLQNSFRLSVKNSTILTLRDMIIWLRSFIFHRASVVKQIESSLLMCDTTL